MRDSIVKLSPKFGPRVTELVDVYEKMIQEDFSKVQAAKAAGNHEAALRLMATLVPKTAAPSNCARTRSG